MRKTLGNFVLQKFETIMSDKVKMICFTKRVKKYQWIFFLENITDFFRKKLFTLSNNIITIKKYLLISKISHTIKNQVLNNNILFKGMIRRGAVLWEIGEF